MRGKNELDCDTCGSPVAMPDARYVEMVRQKRLPRCATCRRLCEERGNKKYPLGARKKDFKDNPHIAGLSVAFFRSHDSPRKKPIAKMATRAVLLTTYDDGDETTKKESK